jgi:membrane associated rhomboid family serine protease
MGIGDRAYMRDRSAPRVPISMTAWVVGILVGFFILGLIDNSAGAGIIDHLTLSQNEVGVWRWLTHALVHLDWLHLLGNCLVLWWTGVIVEKEYGKRTFIWTLTGGALIGALTWYLTGLGGGHISALIGISAGVYALMLVALLDKLDHQITLLLFFFLPVTLKVRWLLILTALFAILGWGFSELPGRHDWIGWKAAWTDGIAHSAHLGGLIFGWLAWRYLNRTNWAPSYAQVQEPMPTDAPSPAFETPTEENPSSRPLTSAQARAEMDMLLDKISSGGFGSLTVGEKRRLEELSARLR